MAKVQEHPYGLVTLLERSVEAFNAPYWEVDYTIEDDIKAGIYHAEYLSKRLSAVLPYTKDHTEAVQVDLSLVKELLEWLST